MIHQITPSRIFFIFGIQPLAIFYFLYVAYRILRRNKNPTTVTLSTFYILAALGFALNIVLVLLTLLQVEFILLIIYFFTIYFILLAPIFLLIFMIRLLYKAPNLSKKKQWIFVLIYGTLTVIVIILPNGIQINETTNWIPIFSWEFLIILYIYYTCTIGAPTIVNLARLYRLFKDKELKKKLRYFSLGIIGNLFSLYGIILYNTWHDPQFRLIWSVISLILVPMSGFLIYYGIGHNL